MSGEQAQRTDEAPGEAPGAGGVRAGEAPAGAQDAPAAAEQTHADAQGEEAAEDDRPAHAWDSRRDLLRHSPGIILGSSARLGGSLVAGDQHGVSGGQVTGDVVLGGSKYEYHLGSGTPEETSGEILAAEVDSLASYFVRPSLGSHPEGGATAGEDCFTTALAELRRNRVLVLSGASSTGRRTAALMLLRAAGATAYRALDPVLPPGRIAPELTGSCGYLLNGLTTSPERPLREHHVRAASEKLRSADGYLVLVTGPRPVLLDGLPSVSWRMPPAVALLRAHLQREDLGGRPVDELLALDVVQDVLQHQRPVAELTRFAQRVAAHARGTVPLTGLADFGNAAVEQQVTQWFDDPDATLHDKAFLIALAAFDEAPYPLTAELSDILYRHLLRTEMPDVSPCIPVFGSSSAKRVEFARAVLYQETEESDWGPVQQTKVQFRDPLTAFVLLREVWTGHPSSRPALVAWLRRLANDSRAVVRTRAAAAAAVLAAADLPSAMGLLIQPWACARRFRTRLAAASALALAHRLDAPHVPRILQAWCTADDHRLRWTAVRTYALAGDAFARDSLDAVLDAVAALDARGGPARAWPEEPDELAQSAASLLLAQAQSADSDGDSLLSQLVPLLKEPVWRGFVLRTFIHACGPTDDVLGGGRPLLLDLYAQLTPVPGTPGALQRQSMAALWRAVLNDPWSTASALEVMRNWVRRADKDPGAEAALAELLPALSVTGEDRKRLAYLLQHLRCDEGKRHPAVADRLHTRLKSVSTTSR
ncbi:hypothetical protein ACFPA8_02065 [Streptomyces ovatisporus]|uniref:LigA protein n=1 Tax=Streptomyces ovatisporus TaxID=1128682 RepID=A0ABV9A2I5_9ACTN